MQYGMDWELFFYIVIPDAEMIMEATIRESRYYFLDPESSSEPAPCYDTGMTRGKY
jgi:hypothetical protein